jgi:4-amino-4-deoxy-L-arabinose transferase-like glycosyltransferase
VGEAGALRLFSEPLVTEASWLLPLALLGLPLTLVVLGWSWPLSDKHLALVLWGGWLLPEVVYFSLNAGLFHAYYLVMLGPPLAALVGATAWALARLCQGQRGLGWGLAALLCGGTLVFQLVILQGYAVWVAALALPLLALGLGLAALARHDQAWVDQAALGITLLALIVAPLYWSGLTTLNTNPNVWLPRSGPGNEGPGRSTTLTTEQGAILAYLLAHTAPDSYLAATLTANDAAPYILATSRPVLTFGGFSGRDEVVDATGLAQMVEEGELRFVLGNMQQKPEIAAWMRDNCVSVTVPGATGTGLASNRAFGPGRPGQGNVLYDCGSY